MVALFWTLVVHIIDERVQLVSISSMQATRYKAAQASTAGLLWLVQG
jgi:hypothetical protein